MKQIQNRETQPSAAATEDIANLNRILFDDCLSNAKACGDGGRFEEVLQWAGVAAWFASRKGWFGELSSPRLEAELLRAAQSLPVPIRTKNAQARPRWVHVLTEAYGTLGHTNLCRRWIQYDEQTIHDVVLVDQKGSAPENLVDTVKKTGGECIVLDPMVTLLERAIILRNYAWQNADVVILHIHPEDVIATTAFGIEGGPPVLFVNHADHAFWVGCAVADLVVDIRKSGHEWTKQARGVPRAAIQPLPLEKKHGESAGDPQLKRKIRRDFGIPEDVTVLLTVGSAHKFKPMRELDFLEAATAILRASPEAYLIAVGPRDEGVWRTAKQNTGGHLLALGPQPDSTLFCRAADLYLEGFPAGSLTALLEAGEAGLACVRAPSACIPPFSSDSPGIEELYQPEDVKNYVAIATGLTKNAKARSELGRKLQKSIHSQHCGSGWLAHLSAIKSIIPKSHSVYAKFQPTPVDTPRRNWAIESGHANTPVPILNSVATDIFVEAWKRTTTGPQIGRELWAKLKASQKLQEPASNLMVKIWDNIALWQLNRRIRRRGSRARFITGANLALVRGNQDLARRLVYSCLFRNFSSTGDVAWIKVLLKSHLSTSWIRQLNRILITKV